MNINFSPTHYVQFPEVKVRSLNRSQRSKKGSVRLNVVVQFVTFYLHVSKKLQA